MMKTVKAEQAAQVLISGASFAGLTTAIWMQRLGYQVTIVEAATSLRKGGTPVDLRSDTMAIFDRMGVLDAVRAKALPPRTTEFADIDGTPIASMETEATADNIVIDEYEIHRHDDVEIHRDDLLAVLLAEIGDSVEVIFGDYITELTATAEGVRAASDTVLTASSRWCWAATAITPMCAGSGSDRKPTAATSCTTTPP